MECSNVSTTKCNLQKGGKFKFIGHCLIPLDPWERLVKKQTIVLYNKIELNPLQYKIHKVLKEIKLFLPFERQKVAQLYIYLEKLKSVDCLPSFNSFSCFRDTDRFFSFRILKKDQRDSCMKCIWTSIVWTTSIGHLFERISIFNQVVIKISRLENHIF